MQRCRREGEEPFGECHILDVASVPAFQFATALNRLVPVTAWQTEMRWFNLFGNHRELSEVGGNGLEIRTIPIQHGYAHQHLNKVLRFEDKAGARLASSSRDPEQAALICTSPFFAPIAKKWPGPVIYYSLDLTYAYRGLKAERVQQLDRDLCRVAQLVCPVSERIGNYFIQQSGCDPGKILVLPNATRAANIRSEPSARPDDLPLPFRNLKRPLVGIIGNLADNLDWELVLNAIQKLPEFYWLFVGPTSMSITDRAQRRARSAVMNLGAHVRFAGPQPYEDLQSFARSFDVALLPYRFREPTYSGSATRFYEHLAACRPMLATPNVGELRSKEPLLSLFETSDQLVHKLRELKRMGFVDGNEGARWVASRSETWEARAETMLASLTPSLPSPLPSAGKPSMHQEELHRSGGRT